MLKPKDRSSECVCSLHQSSLYWNMQSQPCKTCLAVPSGELYSDQNIFLSLHLTTFWTFNYSLPFRLFFVTQRFCSQSEVWTLITCLRELWCTKKGLQQDFVCMNVQNHSKNILMNTEKYWSISFPIQLQIKLLNIKASLAIFFGSRDTTLCFQNTPSGEC